MSGLALRSAFALGWGLGLVLAGATTACQYIGKSSGPAVSGPQAADPEKAREILARAEKARDAGKTYEARQQLAEADRYADDAVRVEIAKVERDLDQREADGLAAPVLEATKKGDCQLGLSQALRAQDRTHGAVLELIEQATFGPLHDCLVAALAKPDGKLLVRRLLDKPRTDAMLGEKGFADVAEIVTKAVVEEEMTPIRPLLAQQKWADVRARIDDLVAKDKAGPRERDRLLGELRSAMVPAIASRAREAAGKDKIDNKTPEAVLAEIDRILADAGWRDKDVPDDLVQARRALVVWLECRELQCKTQSPRRLWALGNVGLQPATLPTAPEQKLAHGSVVWAIAVTKGWALVVHADEVKGGFADLAGRADGWVRSEGLKAEDTSHLLPPGEALIGLRVWGLLRESEPLFELGTVTSAADDDHIGVKRLSDHTDVKVPRAKLYFGATEPGTRVLVQCQSQVPQDPGRIEAVFETSDDPMVSVVCLDAAGTPSGTAHKGPLGALRNKEEWLKR